jgi:membrane fusion protein (multidrug efflux system)
MHFWRWVWTFLFCLIVVSVLGFVKFNQIKAAIAFGESFPEPSETVRSIITEQSQWQSNINVMGEIVATRSLDVRNELAGIVSKVGFNSGGNVAKGDVLLQFDVANEEAQLEALIAQVSIAQLDVNRFAELIKSNASSRDQLDKAIAQLTISKANVRALQTVIAQKTIIAPFDSVAGLHQLEVGSYLSANTQITRLVNVGDEVWVDFSIPQEHTNLSKDDWIKLSSASLLTESHQAKIIAFSQEIDVNSRNLRIRALWSKVPKSIKPGALLKVDLPIGDMQHVVRLPNVAVRYDAFGGYIFVLDKDDNGDWRAARQSIEVLGSEDKTTIVASDFSLGKNIATIGSSKLRAGSLVKIKSGIATDE